jgi:hypothetical protein
MDDGKLTVSTAEAVSDDVRGSSSRIRHFLSDVISWYWACERCANQGEE